MASKYLQKYPVPETFQEILHDFTREVLRDQPDDIVKYAAHYFECLNTGKPFEYQSKYNIPKGAGAKKVYQPQKATDLAHQAKNVVERGNNQAPTSGKHIATEQSRPSSNKMNVSHTSSLGKESYADEKNITKQFMNDILPRAVHEVVNNEDSEDNQDIDDDNDQQDEEDPNAHEAQDQHQQSNHQQNEHQHQDEHQRNLPQNGDELEHQHEQQDKHEKIHDHQDDDQNQHQQQNLHEQNQHLHDEHQKQNDHENQHQNEQNELLPQNHQQNVQHEQQNHEQHNQHEEQEVHQQETPQDMQQHDHHEEKLENDLVTNGNDQDQQDRNQDTLLNAEDFNNDQINKLVKIQSHIRGTQARKELDSKKSLQSNDA